MNVSIGTEAPRKDRLLVAALDFGTTYSGYAFSFSGDFAADPLKIQTNQNWIAGAGLVSEKTATCILLDPDKKCVAFGYEAEDKYSELVDESDEDDDDDLLYKKYYYFRRFKMLLYDYATSSEEHLTRDAMLEDETGKKLPAKLVISLAVGYIKEHLMSLINKRTIGIDENDIHWIITIPAIWDDSAKQFMREAAQDCGIKSDQLSFALEPEAASVYCQLLKLKATEEEVPAGGIARKGNKKDFRLSESGTRCMIVDLGGGTADITVHERQLDGRLREVYEPTGGPWGGTAVDREFFKFLEEILGKKMFEVFKKKQMSDYVELCRDFELKKRTIKCDTSSKIVLKLPASLNDVFQKNSNCSSIKESIAKSKYAANVSWVGGKLKIDAEVVKRFFDVPIQKIVRHVQTLLAKIGRIDMILMVGGFSDCDLVGVAFRSSFPNLQILNPSDGVLAVLKGAVIYGHKPMAITSRVAKYTYGYEAWPTFNPNIHPENLKVSLGSKECCRSVFQPYIKQGEEINCEEFITSIHRPVSDDQKDMAIKIYICKDTSPMFVTDKGVRHIGTLQLPLPKPRPGVNRKIEGHLHFGTTELVVEAKDLDSGDIHKATFDCL